MSAIAVYTGLRVALFLLVWLTLELLTPISGVWAMVAALLISGALSIVFLDRQRSRMAVVADGFFKGLNERIEASARAEDADDDENAPGGEVPSGGLQDAGQPEQPAEGEAVRQQEDPGLLEGGNESGTERPA